MATADHNHAKSLGKIHLNTRLAGGLLFKI
jgi:hypothetical protein